MEFQAIVERLRALNAPGIVEVDEPRAPEAQEETEREAPVGSVNEGCFRRVGEQMVFDNDLCASIERPDGYEVAK